MRTLKRIGVRNPDVCLAEYTNLPTPPTLSASPACTSRCSPAPRLVSSTTTRSCPARLSSESRHAPLWVSTARPAQHTQQQQCVRQRNRRLSLNRSSIHTAPACSTPLALDPSIPTLDQSVNQLVSRCLLSPLTHSTKLTLDEIGVDLSALEGAQHGIANATGNLECIPVARCFWQKDWQKDEVFFSSFQYR